MCAAACAAIQEEMDLEDDPEIRSAVEAALAAQEAPCAWADVTVGVRYLMKGGCIAFHPVPPLLSLKMWRFRQLRVVTCIVFWLTCAAFFKKVLLLRESPPAAPSLHIRLHALA